MEGLIAELLKLKNIPECEAANVLLFEEIKANTIIPLKVNNNDTLVKNNLEDGDILIFQLYVLLSYFITPLPLH